MDDKAAVKRRILDELDGELPLFDFDDSTVAYIITSASKDSVGYKAIVEHLKAYDMKDPNIHRHGYRATSGVGGFEGEPKGKAVVEWVPKAAGAGATLNLYIEKNTPEYTQTFDAQGNPC